MLSLIWRIVLCCGVGGNWILPCATCVQIKAIKPPVEISGVDMGRIRQAIAGWANYCMLPTWPNLLLQVIGLVSNCSKNVDFVWLPSHIGIKGNELTDKLANAATAKPSVDGNQWVALQVSGQNGLHPGQIPPAIPAHLGHHRQALTWQMLFECSSTSDWNASWCPLRPLQ